MKSISFILLVSVLTSFVFANTMKIERRIDHVRERIVGGEDAIPHSFPWQVSMRFISATWEGHNCGGSLITADWVLSAAHCYYSMVGARYEVWAGKHDLSVIEPNEQIRNAVTYIIHEDYDNSIIGPHDIALIKVDEPFVLNAYVQIINLPVANSIPFGDANISGWGSISTDTTSIMPDILQTAVLPILNYETCSSVLLGTFFEYTNVCTGPLEGGISTCGGDSGSGLIQNDVVVGLVSWGWFPCGGSYAPTVHARVSHYIDWINETMDAHQLLITK